MKNIDIIAEMQSMLKELRDEISQLRKKGIDAKIAELKIINIPSKIQMAEITKKDDDIIKARQLILEAKKEIESIRKENGQSISKF